MQSALHYREQAERARRFAGGLASPADTEVFENLAKDFDEIAEDLENGAIEITHPEAMPQK